NPSSTRLTTDKVNAVVRGNGRIALTCVTDANPPPTQYQFYRDGVYLRTSFTGKHVIQKARHYDAGLYQCVPINSLGTGTNSSVRVYVNGELHRRESLKESATKFVPVEKIHFTRQLRLIKVLAKRHRADETQKDQSCMMAYVSGQFVLSRLLNIFRILSWYLGYTCYRLDRLRDRLGPVEFDVKYFYKRDLQFL
ncbi:B-cell receptor cd22, partial [Desmophyllum pertusum]